MAAKTNASDDEVDMTAWEWSKGCISCHPGGGPMEYDRDGQRYDERAPKQDWEAFDGDYHRADWEASGVVEADCLMCHMESYRTSRRTPIAKEGRHRVAPVAGAGMGTSADNEIVDYDPTFALNIDGDPADRNCSQCHGGVPEELFNAAGVLKADIAKRGRSWGDPNNPDVHDGVLNCVDCHGGGEGEVDGVTYTKLHHQFGKGNIMTGSSVENMLDGELGYLDCEGCHTSNTHGAPTPDPQNPLHAALHTNKINCATCHIPHKKLFAVTAFDFLEGTKVPFFKGGSPKNPYAGGILPTYLWWHAEKEPPYTWKIYPFNVLSAAIWNKGDQQRNAFFLKEVKAAIDALPPGTLTDDIPDPKGGIAEPNTTAEIAALQAKMAELYPGTDPMIWISPEGFQLSHNVAPAEEALGAGGCTDCHTKDSPFFSREVRFLPWDFEDSPFVTQELHGHDADGNSFTIKGYEKTLPMWRILGYDEARKDELEEEK